jgi:tripartite-type tricarboxylate transporter receptor subunit TctC
MIGRRKLVRAAFLSAATARVGLARSNAFPERAVRIVVAAAAGSGGDIMARKMSDPLAAMLGQPVVIENRPGANGILAATAVARSRPDGYTMLFASVALLCMNPHLLGSLPYDPFRDFAPVTLAFESSMLLAVGAHVAARSMPEFIALAKSRPGELTIGSAGEGSIQHMGSAQLEQVAGIRLTHVHYASSPQVIVDLLAGRIDAAMEYASVIGDHVLSRRVFALATLGRHRTAALPSVPSTAELGMPQWDFRGWGGFLVPAGTPAAVVEILNKAIASALKHPELVTWSARFGSDLTVNSPEDFASYMRIEDGHCSQVAKALNMKKR